MLLFKDSITNKKSITITILVISVLLTWVSIAGNIYLLLTHQKVEAGLIFGSMAMTGPMLGLYWNKRVRISKSGIDLGGRDDQVD
jgi:hypothetical protein